MMMGSFCDGLGVSRDCPASRFAGRVFSMSDGAIMGARPWVRMVGCGRQQMFSTGEGVWCCCENLTEHFSWYEKRHPGDKFCCMIWRMTALRLADSVFDLYIRLPDAVGSGESGESC